MFDIFLICQASSQVHTALLQVMPSINTQCFIVFNIMNEISHTLLMCYNELYCYIIYLQKIPLCAVSVSPLHKLPHT